MPDGFRFVAIRREKNWKFQWGCGWLFPHSWNVKWGLKWSDKGNAEVFQIGVGVEGISGEFVALSLVSNLSFALRKKCFLADKKWLFERLKISSIHVFPHFFDTNEICLTIPSGFVAEDRNFSLSPSRQQQICPKSFRMMAPVGEGKLVIRGSHSIRLAQLVGKIVLSLRKWLEDFIKPTWCLWGSFW